jgi:hypothetical protein
LEDPVYLEWKSGQDQTEEANHGGLRSSEIEKAHVRGAQHGWRGKAQLGEMSLSTRLSAAQIWTSGGHDIAQKRGKVCREKHRSPTQNRHPRKIIRSFLKSFIWTPDKMVSKIVPKN